MARCFMPSCTDASAFDVIKHEKRSRHKDTVISLTQFSIAENNPLSDKRRDSFKRFDSLHLGLGDNTGGRAVERTPHRTRMNEVAHELRLINIT